jgi:8-oxo-dGTP pyrophosphatase MutT (NUDIX family)
MSEPPVEGFSRPPGAARTGPGVPRVLAERARDLSDGRLTPAVPRDAATVILLRPGDGAGPEVEAFLLRRTAELEFAPGACVFPGGSVDERDTDPGIGWAGPAPEDFAAWLDVPPERARALVCAAIRETFEESGVLLAGADPDSVVADTAAYAGARAALVARDLSLAGFLAAHDLVLRADLLRPWANWLTPLEEARRYDTRFFLAEVPTGQRADGLTTEADHAGWCRPADAIADWRDGHRGLLPPTWVTLADLAEYDTVAAAMAVTRQIDKVMPKVIREDGVVRVVLPGDPRYDIAAAHLDARPGDRLEHP